MIACIKANLIDALIEATHNTLAKN